MCNCLNFFFSETFRIILGFTICGIQIVKALQHSNGTFVSETLQLHETYALEIMFIAHGKNSIISYQYYTMRLFWFDRKDFLIYTV